MKIFALVTDAFGGHGGIAQYNRDFLSACATIPDLRITVLPRNGEGGINTPQGVTQLRGRKGEIVYSIVAAIKVFELRPVDMIFCGHLFMAPLAWVLAKLTGAKFWLQLHGIEAWERPSVLIRWVAEQADLVTVVSRCTRARFLAWSRIEPSKVRVLPNTVDNRFKPGSKPAHLVQRYGLAGKKVLLTVSRLASGERYKGHDRVIQALPGLIKCHPDLVYLIAGDGDDQTRLVALARTENVTDHVRFIGRVAEDELPEIFRLADVYVMPSTGEGFGIVFLEAAATGIPVIGGNCDGSLDALADNRLGQGVNPDDRDAICQVIKSSLDEPKRNVLATEIFGSENFQNHVNRLLAMP